MALVLGTNVGFVTARPTADPGGEDTTIDGSSVVVKDTSPAGSVKITEIGWYRGSGTNTANFEVALYADSSGAAGARLYVDNSNSSSTQGWITVAVDWTISASTAYWLAVQMDAHTGSSTIDSATSGGSGTDVRTTQSSLADPYGGGAVADSDGMYAIYALVQKAPTVVLSNPPDAGETSDATPDLTFTGTDDDGDDIRYEVQVDTVNTFDSQVDTETLTDSYSELNASYSLTMSDETSGFGQCFTANDDGDFTSVKLYMKRDGSPTGNVTVSLYAISGTYGTSGLPTGSALATTTIDASTLPTSYTLVTATFGTPYAVIAGNHYALTVEYTGGSSGNWVRLYVDFSSPTHNGNGFGWNGSAWEVDVSDMCFYAYVTPKISLIDAVSGTNAGFSGSPDNTDPFASAQAVTYTVQSALDPDTYYWRVRGIDPSGSNTYGAWSGTRSFVVVSVTVTSQTITGKARITKSTLQTILGKARVTVSTLRTILGKSRIGLVTSRTIQGVSRIMKVVSQTIAGKSRITKSTSQTITGKAAIQTTTTTDQTILGRARLTVSSLKTILGQSRIGLVTSKVITGISRVTKVVSRTIAGLARVTAATTRTIQGKSRVTASTLKTILGRARIEVLTVRDIFGKSRIVNVVSRTITGISDVLKSTSQTILGKSRIALVTSRIIYGVSRVTSQTLRTIVGRARILIVTSQTIQGISTIGNSASREILGVARITLITIKTITGKARIAIQNSRTIQGVARIGLITTRNILGKSRVLHRVSKYITGISSIAKVVLRSLPGRARITVSTLRDILGVSRLSKTTTQNITGVSAIVKMAPLPKGRVWVRSNKPSVYRVNPKYSYSLALYDESGFYDTDDTYDGEVVQLSSTVLSSKIKSNKPLNYFIAPTLSQRLGIFDEAEPYDELYPYDGEFVPGAASGWKADVKNVKVRVR